MAATWVGSSTDSIIISDNTTPDSGTYAWGIIGNRKIKDPSGFLSRLIARGATTSTKGKFIDRQIPIDTTIPTFAEYEKLLKMLGAWDAGNTLLYISIKNEWGSNLAVYPNPDTPTTLIQIRGKLQNIVHDPQANTVDTKCVFMQCTT